MSWSYAYKADIHNTVSSHKRDEIQFNENLSLPLLATKGLFTVFNPTQFAEENLADVFAPAVRERKRERCGIACVLGRGRSPCDLVLRNPDTPAAWQASNPLPHRRPITALRSPPVLLTFRRSRELCRDYYGHYRSYELYSTSSTINGSSSTRRAVSSTSPCMRNG